MQSIDLIRTARDLVESAGRGRPRESNLRRAVSTTYYALFHCLAECCANILAGRVPSNRIQPAWRQTYRALQHSTARSRCRRQDTIGRFPYEIQDFAELFIEIQAKRHSADYDPDAAFDKSNVLQDIDVSEDAINRFNEAPRRDRRAFAIYVLLDIRSGYASSSASMPRT